MSALTVAAFAIRPLSPAWAARSRSSACGTVRADWNPAYGLPGGPLVFLARFNGFASIVRTVLRHAADRRRDASRRLGVPNIYVLVLVALCSFPGDRRYLARAAEQAA